MTPLARRALEVFPGARLIATRIRYDGVSPGPLREIWKALDLEVNALPTRSPDPIVLDHLRHERHELEAALGAVERAGRLRLDRNIRTSA